MAYWGNIKEARLGRLRNIKRKCVDATVRRCERLVVGSTQRGRGIPKKY